MKWNPKKSIPRTLLLLAGFSALLLSGCLGVEPKNLGQNLIDFSALGNGTAANFNFNFALLGSTVGTATTFYLQGALNSQSASVGTCNLSGTGCTCDFLNSAGNVLQTTTTANIFYDQIGNYYRCIYNGAGQAAVTAVRIKNIAGTATSANINVQTTANLTLSQLLGNTLDSNRVRQIYRYSCQFNFLQKQGTTTQGFDCKNSLSSCDPGNPDPARNFCFLQTRFPYYLFSDNVASNFSQKIADKLYNSAGSGTICGQQIKNIDCADADGLPVKAFGLYSQQTGIWDTSVNLGAGPDISPISYGYAARTSVSTAECPPGLLKKVFFQVTVTTGDIIPSHNFTDLLVATEVNDPASTPTAFTITSIAQGHCDPLLNPPCSLPTSYAGNPMTASGLKQPQPYSSAGQTVFCVIPAGMLP